MVPPPSAARATCSPSRAKSADKIDGASSIKVLVNLGLINLNAWECVRKFYHAKIGWLPF
jgi:hypothetical protein